MPIEFLLNCTLEAFYPLRLCEGCSLVQILQVLATVDKEGLKRNDFFNAYSFSKPWRIYFTLKDLPECLELRV